MVLKSTIKKKKKSRLLLTQNHWKEANYVKSMEYICLKTANKTFHRISLNSDKKFKLTWIIAEPCGYKTE